MRGQIDERYEFQQYIISQLKKDSYIERDPKKFNRLHAMDPDLFFDFLQRTQPETVEALQKIYGDEFKETIINSINRYATSKTGTLLDLLKHGISISNHKINLLYNKPATDFNPELTKKYQQNIFSVMQEVWASDHERIDLVIFLNGIAIITLELKSNSAGQSYEDAIDQYRTQRDPKDRLFLFKAGSLVNFAMDLNEVYMTTKLEGKKTTFMPFNKGKGEGINSGAGNQILKNDYSVSYMWKDILTKDTIIELITKFIFIEKDDKSIPQRLIFPRYHQLDAIRKIVADLKINHTSQNYLIEHSAGSGKTNTISWLAHRLASLHDDQNNMIFDNVIVMTDRIVVDRQLQKAITGIEHKSGLIRIMNEECTSADLKRALESNTKIVVTTIQKFPYVVDLIQDEESNVENLGKKKYAVIIDEAHSSTAGKDMMSVTQTLANRPHVAVTNEDSDDETDLQDVIRNEIKSVGKQPNVSIFAFTATPKPTTLALFGRRDKYGNYKAFHLYSMKQAIEEGYILDVLANYTTYHTYYQLNKEIEEDPELQTADAKRQIAKYIDTHDTNVKQRTEIIVEHFRKHVLPKLGGQAKAMVVTASRIAAVKYSKAFDAYIKEKGYNDIHTLVAFSGKVNLKGDATEYTESSMNGFQESNTAKKFDTPEYNVLLVANKYQTGFDQPKLTAMYIMKKLKGVNAVQTLSRLNRVCPPYDKTPFVLDFVNSYNDMEKAFAPYYTTTLLANTVSPQAVYNLDSKIDGFYVIDLMDVDNANTILHKPKITSRDKMILNSYFARANERMMELPPDDQHDFFVTLKHFCRFYEFLLQISDLEDIELQKKYTFISYLLKYIDIRRPGQGYDLTGKIKASDFVQEQTGKYEVKKRISQPILNLPTADNVAFSEGKKEKLSQIIAEINNRTGSHLDENVAAKSLLQLKDLMLKSDKLKSSAKHNSEKDFELSYFDNIDNILVEGLEQNKDFFKLLLNNKEIKKEVLGVFVDEIYKDLRDK